MSPAESLLAGVTNGADLHTPLPTVADFRTPVHEAAASTFLSGAEVHSSVGNHSRLARNHSGLAGERHKKVPLRTRDGNVTFAAWYARYNDVFEKNVARLGDEAQIRLLIRK